MRELRTGKLGRPQIDNWQVLTEIERCSGFRNIWTKLTMGTPKLGSRRLSTLILAQQDTLPSISPAFL